MGTFQQFWRQPQRVWLRKAIFQVHLWTGIGAGLYVLLISISGSAIVFRNDIYAANTSPVIIVEGVGERMTTRTDRRGGNAGISGLRSCSSV